MTNKPIYWHQGLFLQPNHFQYLDAFHLDTQQAIRQNLLALPWGVAFSDLDAGALATGRVSFNQLRVLLRDGSWLHFPDNAQLEDLHLQGDVWPDSREPLQIHLVIAAKNQRLAVQSSSQPSRHQVPRYSLSDRPESLADQYQAGDPVQTPLLTFSAKLVTSTQLSTMSGIESLPVARLILQNEQVYSDPEYLPPMLSISALPEMLAWVRNLRDELLSRSTQLEDYKQPPANYRGSDFNPQMLRYRMALQTLGRSVQVLSHLLELANIPPERVYQEVRTLIAELSCFSISANIRGEISGSNLKLPSYDHLDLGDCFTKARQIINRLVNEIAIGSESLARFSQQENSNFLLELPRKFLEAGQQVFLVVRTQLGRDKWLESFLRFSKLGTPTLVPIYQARALPGVDKTLLEVRPEGLPQRPNSTYFVLSSHDEAWLQVEREGMIELAWPNMPDDLTLELVAIKG